jgi:hypothetical protein
MAAPKRTREPEEYVVLVDFLRPCCPSRSIGLSMTNTLGRSVRVKALVPHRDGSPCLCEREGVEVDDVLIKVGARHVSSVQEAVALYGAAQREHDCRRGRDNVRLTFRSARRTVPAWRCPRCTFVNSLRANAGTAQCEMCGAAVRMSPAEKGSDEP